MICTLVLYFLFIDLFVFSYIMLLNVCDFKNLFCKSIFSKYVFIIRFRNIFNHFSYLVLFLIIDKALLI